MAEASISANQFTCSVCLELLKDPVTIHCGHSYCMSCIKACWDQDEGNGVYSCPQCRQTFTTRPVLGKNTILVEMIEKLRKTQFQAAVPEIGCTGSGDVECDICSGPKQKAVKACLVCQESYCQTHFERHDEFHSGKPHKVIDATGRLQEMICVQHGKQLEIYCRTDQKAICYLCTIDEHKNHDTVTAATERSEKQKQLEERQRDIQQEIQQKERDLQKLKDDLKNYKCSAKTAVEDCERIFTELICSIERRSSEVTQLIRDQEKAAVSKAEGQLQDLELKIDDLRRRDAELEELSHTYDHIHFLQRFQSLSYPGVEIFNVFNINVLLPFEDVKKSVSRLREKLEDFFKEEIQNISSRAAESQPSLILVPKEQPRPIYIPELQPRPILAPNVQPRPNYIPKLQPMPIPAPNVQPRPNYIPKLQHRPIPAPNVQPRPNYIPKLQPMPIPAPNVQPRPNYIPKLQPMPIPAPNVQPRPNYIPKLQPRFIPVHWSEPGPSSCQNQSPGP